MRIQTIPISQTLYYRSSTRHFVPAQYIASAVAPHALTQRATANSIVEDYGYVDLFNVTIVRNTVATTSGLITVLLDNGAPPGTANLWKWVGKLAAAGDSASFTVPFGVMYDFYNDSPITLFTADASTGGSIDYFLSLLVNYFS